MVTSIIQTIEIKPGFLLENRLGFDKLIGSNSSNNCIKSTRSDINENIFYEYDYNTDGYPTEERNLFNGVVRNKIQYFY